MVSLSGGVKGNEIEKIQIAIAFPSEDGDEVYGLPIDDSLYDGLVECLNNTIRRIRKSSEDRGGPFQYEPSEDYGSDECVVIKMVSSYCEKLKSIYNGDDYDIYDDILEEIDDAFYYFVEFFGENGQKIVGVHRVSSFSSALKKRGRFVRWADSSLTTIDEPVLLLDSDFDFIFDGEKALILRPKPFAAIADIENIVMEAAVKNLQIVKNHMKSFDLKNVEDYVASRKSAARLISSVVAREDVGDIDDNLFYDYAHKEGVSFDIGSDGTKYVKAGHESKFLKALDRRLYSVHIIKGKEERFEARNRKKV